VSAPTAGHDAVQNPEPPAKSPAIILTETFEIKVLEKPRRNTPRPVAYIGGTAVLPQPSVRVIPAWTTNKISLTNSIKR
jgi:hypothetical protein